MNMMKRSHDKKETKFIFKRNGFTMAELLIVVAIIGILVVISIPIFNQQLEKSREAHDIYTMRAVATLALDYYYSGAVTKEGAEAIGLSWWNDGATNENASGAYDPTTGKFVPVRTGIKKAYGKGTAVDGGMTYDMGNRNAYKNDADYTDAVCMISIYPKEKHIDVYWKKKNGGGNDFIGGYSNNKPLFSLQLPVN